MNKKLKEVKQRIHMENIQVINIVTDDYMDQAMWTWIHIADEREWTYSLMAGVINIWTDGSVLIRVFVAVRKGDVVLEYCEENTEHTVKCDSIEEAIIAFNRGPYDNGQYHTLAWAHIKINDQHITLVD